MPLIRRIVTVTGSGTNEPKNLEVRVGTPLKCVFDACGGVKENTFKILMGGPMMGNAQYIWTHPSAKRPMRRWPLPATKKNGGTSCVHPLRQVRHGVPDAPGASDYEYVCQ
ncbi:SLBB domain-containing protein [Intestinimonas butyriciproducens]|uniref:SLBB domain-containing protein n=1 Tax=Intestinimonas butyriciproducens TaxID=1297617 RepID=UPI0039951778